MSAGIVTCTMTTDENITQGPSIEVRPAGNTYHVYIDGNTAGSFTKHADADGTPYYNAYLGASGKPRLYPTEEEVTEAVVRYHRTGR